MAESVRNLPGFFHCERLGCSLFPEACGQRHARATVGHLPGDNSTCGSCPVGARHAAEFGCEPPKGPRPKQHLNLAVSLSEEARVRRVLEKQGESYPEQVRRAKAILEAVERRRARK